MSDGLKYLRRVIDDGDRSKLFQTSEDDYIDGDVSNEVSVYNYMMAHASEFSELPSVAAVRQETGVRLPDAPDVAEYYLGKIVDRKIFNAAREINRDFRDDMASRDTSNIYAIGRRFMDIANDPRITDSSMHDHEGMARTVDSARDLMRQSAPSISTGFPSIDAAMMGGLRSSDFVFLVARTNVGKTQLLLNGARSAYEAGNKILIISMEMVMDDMSLLFMSHLARINPKYVNPYTLGHYTSARMDRVLEQMRDEDRVFIHKGGASMTPNKVRWLIESMRPDIVYVDSMYLMSPDGANTSRMDRYSKIAMVTDQMLDIIVECGVPIMNTSQLNRQAGKGGVDASLETLGFSDTISTHASLIIGMKMVYAGEGQTDVQHGVRTIEVMKSRKGQLAPFNINFNFAPLDFSEVEPEEEESDDRYEQHLIEELLDDG